MDGENNGKPYEQMGWFGGPTHIFGNTHIYLYLAKIYDFHVGKYTGPVPWILWVRYDPMEHGPKSPRLE